MTDWGALFWAFAPAPIGAIFIALFMLWYTRNDDAKPEAGEDRP